MSQWFRAGAGADEADEGDEADEEVEAAVEAEVEEDQGVYQIGQSI